MPASGLHGASGYQALGQPLTAVRLTAGSCVVPPKVPRCLRGAVCGELRSQDDSMLDQIPTEVTSDCGAPTDGVSSSELLGRSLGTRVKTSPGCKNPAGGNCGRDQESAAASALREPTPSANAQAQ